MKIRKNLAFIIDGKVEKILNTFEEMAVIFLNGYSFVDKTTETENHPAGQFLFEVSNEEYGNMEINSDESLFTILQSNPLIVEIPEGIEVQVGWNYDGANFTA